MEGQPVMADRLVRSLRTLAEEKRGLEDKARQLRQVEQQLMSNLGRLLSRIGYRLVSHNGGAAATRPRIDGRSSPKRIRCPECDRRFGRPLHLARHMSAIHRHKKSAAAPTKRNH